MNLFWTVAVLIFCLRGYFILEAKYERYKQEFKGSKNFGSGQFVFLVSEMTFFLASTYLLIHLFKLLELI